MDKIARFIKELPGGFKGRAALYKCEPPMEYKQHYYSEHIPKSTKFVVVSSTKAMFSGNQTCIFPANEDGEITSWGEIDGSCRGGLEHAEALEGAGYAIEY